MKKKKLKDQIRAKEQAKKEQRQRRKELTPLLLSFVLWLTLVAIVHLDIGTNAIARFFIDLSVWSTYIFAKITFIPVEMKANLITLFGFKMRVVPSCTIYEYYMLVISIVVFARWSVRDKLINAGVIIGLLFVLNILRFVIMGIIGKYYQVAFDTAHDYFWNIMFALVTLGLWAWRNEKSKTQKIEPQKN